MTVGGVMVGVGLMGLVTYRFHILMMLLSLEFGMLGVYYILLGYLGSYSGEMYFILVFLTFMACEGALGLGLVVLVNKTHGNDCLALSGLLEC